MITCSVRKSATSRRPRWVQLDSKCLILCGAKYNTLSSGGQTLVNKKARRGLELGGKGMHLLEVAVYTTIRELYTWCVK